MRKLLAMLCLCVMLLSGCTDTAEVEELAFAEILGVDLIDGNQIEVCIEIPKIAGHRGESSSGSSGGSSNLIYSASGESFDEALNLLQWAVPRRLDLSQIKLIAVSEALVQSERFHRVAGTIMATPRLYTAARLAVCKGSAKEFVTAEEPIIGTRLASELTATFEDYIRNGYIPDVTFADMFYKSKSVYSDSLAIYAETAPKSEPAPSESGEAKPAVAIIPDSPQGPSVEMQHSNRFLGAAVFRKGVMIGKLTGEEFLYCKMLRGESQTFPFAVDGQTVGLATMGTPEIVIDLKSDPIRINIRLKFSIVSSSKSAPIDKLQSELKEEFMNVIEICKLMKAEPFDFSGSAAGSFLTIEEWERFDWLQHFLSSDIHIDIAVHGASK